MCIFELLRFSNLLSCHNLVEKQGRLSNESWKKALCHKGIRFIKII